MTEINVPYGRGTMRIRIPREMSPLIVRPVGVPAAEDPGAEIERALDHPIGGRHLDSIRGARNAVIVVSDKTRPMPNQMILPPLVNRLNRIGIRDQDVTLLIATGAHRPMSSSEHRDILPTEISDRFNIISHDARDTDQLEYLGATTRGTPVLINRRYLEADARIITGLIEPHQFAGMTGGIKSVAIGLAGIATIEANHSMLNHPSAKMADFVENTVRLDIEEIGNLAGCDFALNIIVNEKGEIARAFAGSANDVFLAGAENSRKLAVVEIPSEVDVTIASPGGYPKDINLYQTQKALAHAMRITRAGGMVILVAECSEGSGSDQYQSWMESAASLEEVVDRFEREGFTLGAHKAYLWARDLTRAEVFLVSSLDALFVKRMHFIPAESPTHQLEVAKHRFGPTAKLAVMPKAMSTVATVRHT